MDVILLGAQEVSSWRDIAKSLFHLWKCSGVLTIWPKNLEISVGIQMVIKVIFHSEIVEYLIQRYSSFSIRNGTAENFLPFE